MTAVTIGRWNRVNEGWTAGVMLGHGLILRLHVANVAPGRWAVNVGPIRLDDRPTKASAQTAAEALVWTVTQGPDSALEAFLGELRAGQHSGRPNPVSSIMPGHDHPKRTVQA